MKGPGRSLLYLFALVFLGVGTAFVTYAIVRTRSSTPPRARQAETSKPTQTVTPPLVPGGISSPVRSETRRGLDAAAALLKTGKLQEAQDRYLDVLLTMSSENPEALDGLVQVRRRATTNNAALLKRQGEAYKAAARRGGGGEHYTSQALWLLARASYLAIAQMELEDNGRSTAAAQAPPTRAEQSPQASRGARGPADARSGSVGSPEAPVPAPQVGIPTPSGPVGAPPPSDNDGPKLTARIGPLAEGDDADRLAAQLQREGFAATVATETSEAPRRYVVVSEPTTRQTAEARARSLGTLGIKTSIVELDDGHVRLLFGTSSQADEARALARQVRARGYPAIVVPEGGTLYFVLIGPHAKVKMDELLGRLSTGTFPVVIAPAP